MALIEALADRARGADIRRLTLRVLSTNAPARALYKRAGFEVEGVLREAFWLEGAYVDDVLMGLRPDPSASRFLTQAPARS